MINCRLIWLSSAAVLVTLASGTAFAQSVDTSPLPRWGITPIVTNPDWISRPTAADLERFYPPEAARQGLGGTVRLDCWIDSGGWLVRCQVRNEQPAGLGFGDAALMVAPLFRMTSHTRNGEPVGGAKVTVPVRFGPRPLPSTSPP
jgi:periplasmic protein TonB